jgi:hypothetical protein
MNTDRPARSPRRWTDVRRPTASIVLNPPPAWLAEISDRALMPSDAIVARRTADRILDALRRRGVYARPTLAEVEAERARRGLRSGVVIGTEPAAPRPIVLPMPTTPTPRHSAEEIREEGRRNRARIEEALGDLAGDVPGIYTLGFVAANAARRREEAA